MDWMNDNDEKINLDIIFEMMDWKNNQEIQDKGVELAKNVSDISDFVSPMYRGKSVSENCA